MSDVVQHQVRKLVQDGVADPGKLLDSAAGDITTLTHEKLELQRALQELLGLYDQALGITPRRDGYTYAEMARLAEIRRLAGESL